MNHHNVEQEEHEAVVELVKESGDMVTLNVQSIKQEKIIKLSVQFAFSFADIWQQMSRICVSQMHVRVLKALKNFRAMRPYYRQFAAYSMPYVL